MSGPTRSSRYRCCPTGAIRSTPACTGSECTGRHVTTLQRPREIILHTNCQDVLSAHHVSSAAETSQVSDWGRGGGLGLKL